MTNDLEARVVQAAREACVKDREWTDPDKLFVISGAGDQYVEVYFAILGARAALAEIERDGEWQPIETAPKDGTVVLVYAAQSAGWNGTHAARWVEGNHTNGWGHSWRHASYQNLGDGVSGRVSHWRPLPDAPK